MRAYPDGVYYLKSARTGIEIDFYVPEARHIIQAAWSIEGNAFERETGSIMKFAESSDTGHTYTIVTYEEERVIESGGIVINVVPLMKFLINI